MNWEAWAASAAWAGVAVSIWIAIASWRKSARADSRAGEILAVYDSASFESDAAIEHKDDRSPLTAADLASHRCIVAGLRTLTPEETAEYRRKAGEYTVKALGTVLHRLNPDAPTGKDIEIIEKQIARGRDRERTEMLRSIRSAR